MAINCQAHQRICGLFCLLIKDSITKMYWIVFLGSLSDLRRLPSSEKVLRGFGSHLWTRWNVHTGHGLVGEGRLSFVLPCRRKDLELGAKRNDVTLSTVGRQLEWGKETFGSVAFAAWISGDYENSNALQLKIPMLYNSEITTLHKIITQVDRHSEKVRLHKLYCISVCNLETRMMLRKPLQPWSTANAGVKPRDLSWNTHEQIWWVSLN